MTVKLNLKLNLSCNIILNFNFNLNRLLLVHEWSRVRGGVP